MVSSRDLLEAQAFRRRALVEAFVRGHVDGGSSTAPRAGRVWAGGLVLAVLLVGGVLVLGLFGLFGLGGAPGPPGS